MSKQSPETNAQAPQRRLSHANAYSAHVQEAMRYDKLGSAEYPLVMSIMHAVLQGYSEEQWKEEQQRTVKTLTEQQPDTRIAHADVANRYEQLISVLKDLTLWPW